MAQEIMVAGAIYEDVPSVRLPDSNGVFHPFTDTSDTTAVAADVAQGKTFHLADGSAATGTAAGATLVTKTVTANGTYDAGDDGADGYSEVTVNVSGGGGGGGGVAPKDVDFIDYDGTIVHSYTAAEFAALTALPANPSHDGLVAQGWNWTLSDAQDYVAEYGTLTIGQMYVTESGDTEIDIRLHEGRLSPYLGLAINGTATIDWGDGSTPDTVTGTSVTVQIRTRHDYAAAGSYTISVHVVSGTLYLFGTSAASLLNSNSTTATQNYIYSGRVLAMRAGDSVSVGSYAFTQCHNLRYVTLAADTTFTGSYTFDHCYGLSSVTIPRNVRLSSTNSRLFIYCTSLASVSVRSISLVADHMFSYCYGLLNVNIPTNATTIDSDAFYSCTELASITIPPNVTTIYTYAFSSCTGLGEIHFKRSTPPTVRNSNAFYNLPTDCKIYVPTGSLSAYTSASNYPSSSTYTYVEE